MNSITVRRARAEDDQIIADFNIRMAMETENLALDPSTIFPGVRAVFADPSRGQYFVAETGGNVVGCLMITHEWSDWRNGDLWWIQSVYVRADYRGRGVYRALHGHLEALARATPGVVGLRLYCEMDNRKAQQAYAKAGLEPGGYLVLQNIWGRGPAK